MIILDGQKNKKLKIINKEDKNGRITRISYRFRKYSRSSLFNLAYLFSLDGNQADG